MMTAALPSIVYSQLRWMRLSTCCRSSSFILWPIILTMRKSALIFWGTSCRTDSSLSMRMTSNPYRARLSATPMPMTPAPITAALFESIYIQFYHLPAYRFGQFHFHSLGIDIREQRTSVRIEEKLRLGCWKFIIKVDAVMIPFFQLRLPVAGMRKMDGFSRPQQMDLPMLA